MTAPRFGMVAGEASSDLIASLMLAGLKKRWPGLSAAGIGGPKLKAHGFDAWWPSSKLSIFGYVDALLNIRELLSIRRQLGNRLLADPPSAFIGIDAPDFNFGLETRLRAAGIKTVHFVCPSIWAWRPERVEKIRAAADHVLCLFPFEPELLRKHGIAATYVGHPLADEIPMQFSQNAARAVLEGHGLPADRADALVALLPGSRRSEIQHIAEPMLGAAALMQQERPGLHFVLPVVPGLMHLIAPLAARHPGLNLTLLEGLSHKALAACDLTLVASGTATLEAALFKRPMVVCYRVGRLNAWRMRGRNLLPWVSLPNVLANEFLVPELIQEQCTAENLAREGLAWLNDPARHARVQARFEQQHQMLRCNTAQAAADAIAQVLGA